MQQNLSGKNPLINQDSLFEQMVNITKASAYDILVEQVKKLKIENSTLKINLNGAEERIKALKEFINDVRPKDAINAELPPINKNDIPDELFRSPNIHVDTPLPISDIN